MMEFNLDRQKMETSKDYIDFLMNSVILNINSDFYVKVEALLRMNIITLKDFLKLLEDSLKGEILIVGLGELVVYSYSKKYLLYDVAKEIIVKKYFGIKRLEQKYLEWLEEIRIKHEK